MTRTETIPMALKCKINWCVSDIEQIPGPNAEPWRWSDVFVARGGGVGYADPSIGVKLRDAGLLVKQSDGRYQTSEKLSVFMEEEHGVDMSRPVFGLTTMPDPVPIPASQSLSETQKPHYQATIEEYTGTPASGTPGLRKNEG
ncbi:hypothetical protein EXE46_15630 [Halorubrum sp. GN11_10-6_MGM]|uniref:hypothetical protein n=1 Tax=Halorubrum sp. GN11_10-6_MGM TaxID=2518112 RepID=UPI0010F4A9C3|nr:hypothetical protein [Halorubrum sp. GN11_10-6_MGM]TKX72613.1 hypothetical protein EXE46_15630 [Halorubrum sp. GN11_10-6_MGM]